MSPPTLNEESRALARSRILDAAKRALAERGVAVTVDDVAARAEVGRRTVFRYFGTQGELLSQALEDMWGTYVAARPAPPEPGTSWEAWLEATLERYHELHETVIGQAFWGLHDVRPGGYEETGEWRSRFVEERANHAREVAGIAWRAAGGRRHPPVWVVHAVALHLSAFASNGSKVDGLQSPEETAALGARVLTAVLHSAVEEQRRR